ncbi:hypothetical protein M2407_005195 [Serratia sp. BIGb0234]|uniref:hypothetical protein n=1 Tax=Serratia sp. BIGb0234 TaxID=2940614 RepID=UPI00216A1F01|nr:hypothetical protein [Serratia sp. BIGb0234]MCS4320821.1 hypothetical protein [Serratia sp. BIGb0234]
MSIDSTPSLFSNYITGDSNDFLHGEKWKLSEEEKMIKINGLEKNKNKEYISQHLDELEILAINYNHKGREIGNLLNNYFLYQILDKTNEIKYELKNKVHIGLAFLPRYLYLLTEILKKISEYDNKENTDSIKNNFLGFVEEYLLQCVEKLSYYRRSLIVRRMAGPRLEFSYIYDEYYERSLTEWVELTDETAEQLSAAQDLLTGEIVSSFILTLELDKLEQLIITIKGDCQCNDNILLQNDNQLNDDKRTQYLKRAHSIILPEISEHHCKSLIAHINERASKINAPVGVKYHSRQLVTDFLKIRLEKNLSPVIKKLLGRTLIGTISPFFMIIFDIIFPSNSPGMEEIKAEIDKRISAALDKYEFEQMKKKFDALLDAYLFRMETVKNNNKSVAEQEQWDLGRPEDWEPIIFMCMEIKNYFYNNIKFKNDYEAAQLISDFNSIYFLLLNFRLQCFNDGDDITTTIEYMKEMLNGWYNHLQNLISVGFFDIHASNDILLHKVNPLTGQWNTVDGYQAPDTFTRQLSGYDRWDRIRWTHDMIRERIRLYLLLNTQVINLCAEHHSLVTNFNKIFNMSLVSAENLALPFIERNYVDKMQEHLSKSPYSDGGGWSGLTLPAFSTNYNSSLKKQFSTDDCFVWIYTRQGERKLLSLGDYNNLNDFTDPQNPLPMDIHKIYVPRGFRVIFYSEPSFGEREKSEGKEIEYHGRSWYLPETQGDNTKFYWEYTSPQLVQSMKIRLDPRTWFAGIKKQTVGRISYLTWYEPKPGFWTTGDIELPPKP